MTLDEHRAANLANWNERVAGHIGPGGYNLAGMVDAQQSGNMPALGIVEYRLGAVRTGVRPRCVGAASHRTQRPIGTDQQVIE